MSSELEHLKRYSKLVLPAKQSLFLWGARKVGKSTFLRQHYPDAVYYDLLKMDVFLSLLKTPSSLREEILALDATALEQPIIIDEIQKIPELLNEIHWLIENTKASFILCGSSTRKLKRGAANLLGGRAWRQEFYPLVYPEILNFDLLRALNHGLIPSHYLQAQPQRSLKAYIQDYLHEEIQAEGLIRQLASFARFIDAMALSHGGLLNFSNVARDCAIDAKTVKEYYQILVDTLLGYFILPFRKKAKRKIIGATPKFYFFDVGVLNAITKRTIHDLAGSLAGEAFEHYILMELIAHRGLNNLDHDICYWRTKTGLEVDFILGNADIAIEVKISNHVTVTDIRGLLAFQEEFQPKHAIVVCQAPRKRKIKLASGHEIKIYPWHEFLKILWQAKKSLSDAKL